MDLASQGLDMLDPAKLFATTYVAGALAHYALQSRTLAWNALVVVAIPAR